MARRTLVDLHVLRGTFRKDRHGAQPAGPTGELPTCPSWLCGDARREWRRLAPVLHAQGRLDASSRAVFAAYCSAWGEYTAAEQQIAAQGEVLTDAGGKQYPNPRLKIRDAAAGRLMKAAAEMGLTPASRGRVVTPPTRPGSNDKAKFFKHG